MKDLKHPVKPFFQKESDVDVTILSNEESDAEEEYHTNIDDLLVLRHLTHTGYNEL